MLSTSILTVCSSLSLWSPSRLRASLSVNFLNSYGAPGKCIKVFDVDAPIWSFEQACSLCPKNGKDGCPEYILQRLQQQ